jgi:uncharacterized protein (TIGR00369 family)
MTTLMADAIKQQDFVKLASQIPYAQLIGIHCIPIGEHFIFKLPKHEGNLGNPSLPAIHGGVIGGFMETAGILHVMMNTGLEKVPKVVDFSIDYLRPGRDVDSFAICDVVRQGRKIANVTISAWQTRQEQPIATARAHFLLS